MITYKCLSIKTRNTPETIRATNHFIRNKYPGANGLKPALQMRLVNVWIASATQEMGTL